MSGKAVNQGALIGGKMCSYCNEKPEDMEKESIKCMRCNQVFHTTCLLKPLSENDVQHINDNPSMWWFCLNCMSVKSSDSSSHSAAPTDAPVDVMLKSTLTLFKKEILTLVGETIDQKFKDNAPGNTNNTNVSEVTASSALSTCTTHACSKPAWHTPHATPALNSAFQCDSTDDFPNLVQPEKHVLLLNPTNAGLVEAENFRKDTVKFVNNAMGGVNVNFCKVKKSGVVALGFDDINSKNKAEQLLSKSEEITKSFSTSSPKKLLPKVTVFGINEVVFDACDKENKDEMKSVLLKDILARNLNIANLLSSDENESLDVVMLQKVMPSNNQVTYTAALKMSSNVRKVMHNNGNKLFISLSRCKVVDRYHILQCYHCQRPGHLSEKCQDFKNNAPHTCYYCAGSHRSKECEHKLNRSKMCCANCLRSNDPSVVAQAKTHNAADPKCPVMQSFRNNMKGKTVQWLGKN